MENSNLPMNNTSIMDAIRDKIKASFVELIPEENWNKLVEAEVKAFFETPCKFSVERKNNGGWREPDKHQFNFEGADPTMFRTLVWDMCIEKTRTHLESEHITNMLTLAFEERRDETTGETRNLIRESIPLMINMYFENIAKSMTNNLAMAVQNAINNNHPIGY